MKNQNGIISKTEHHSYTIERRANGFRVVKTEMGIASGTFDTFRDAMRDIQANEEQTALVKAYGVDGAIAILRGHSTASQSAQ